MTSLHCPLARFDRNPQVEAALVQLGVLLDDYHYSSHAKGRVLAYTAANGTPAGCPELDPADEADAEAVFVAELPEVPFDSECWSRDESVYLDVEMLVAGTHPVPFGEPDAPDADPAIRFAGIASLAERMALPPVCGGSDEAEYSDDDHAAHMAWLVQIEAGYPPDDQVEPATLPIGLRPSVLEAVSLALWPDSGRYA